MPKLGGEFQDPNDDVSDTLLEAWQNFLYAVQLHAPAVLSEGEHSLREAVFPQYERATESGKVPRWLSPGHLDGSHYEHGQPERSFSVLADGTSSPVVHEVRELKPLSTEDAERLSALHHALNRWVDYFHLRHELAIRTALGTLPIWTGSGYYRWCWNLIPCASRMLGAQFDPERKAYPDPPSFAPAPWRNEEQGQSWPDYKAKQVEAFKKHLEAYREQELKRAGEQGLVPAPEKHGSQHFEWLARYQCGGEKQETIADGAGVSKQAVGNAIRDTAALIGLTLREGRAASRTTRQRNRGR